MCIGVPDWSSFGSDAVPEAVNPDMYAFLCFNPECRHRSMHTILDDVVGEVRRAVRVGEEIAVRVQLVEFVEPVAQRCFIYARCETVSASASTA